MNCITYIHSLVKEIFNALGVEPFEEFAISSIDASAFVIDNRLHVYYIPNTVNIRKAYVPAPFDINDILKKKDEIEKLTVPTGVEFIRFFLTRFMIGGNLWLMK